MIDFDKIEAAARAANRDDNTMRDIELHWLVASPSTVLEMVSMLREHVCTVVELRCEVMTLATQVADLKMKAIERDAVLKQAWDALVDTHDAGRPKTSAAIDSIRRVLE